MANARNTKENDTISAILECVKRIEKDVRDIREDLNYLKYQNNTTSQSTINLEEETVAESEEEEEEEAKEKAPIARTNHSAEKLKLVENPDQRGPRTLDLGWVWEDKRLTLVERYHTMFQLLNKMQNGEDAEPLKESDLIDTRKRLLKLARVVRNMIYADFAGIRYFTELVTVDQIYYQLLLEEKVASSLGVHIFLCKDMWCARTLLRESFKAGNRGFTTMEDVAREKVKRRKIRERMILKEKARLRKNLEQLKHTQHFKPVKVEPEEDPELLAIKKTIKVEENPRKKLRSSSRYKDVEN